jgi:isopenicillin N synthase-like dioxygenase
MDRIPVIDIGTLAHNPADPDTVAAIFAACRDIGFLSITGTGVLPALVTRMRDMVQRIFAIDEQAKWDQAIRRENYRGYIPFGFFTPNDGSGQADLYEGYKLHHEVAADDPLRAQCPLYGPNVWPDHCPEARDTVLAYWAAMDGLVLQLLGALAAGLNVPADAFQQPFQHPLTNMTLLHYPPQDPQAKGYGIHPHKDTDALTIIAPDPVGGLEVKTTDGAWITVECPPGGFVVNIGDMLELWSGGRLVSTPHRVINRSGKERYSFPYFAVPRHDVTVQPLLAALHGFDRPPVNCGHWSAEIWRTNWPDESADETTPELGTLTD